MSKVTLSYELDYCDDQGIFHDLVHASNASLCLYELDSALSDARKYNHSLNEAGMDLIVRLQEIIVESGALRCQ